MTETAPTHKRCHTCQRYRGIDDFHRSNTSRDGYMNDCRTCRRVKDHRRGRETPLPLPDTDTLLVMIDYGESVRTLADLYGCKPKTLEGRFSDAGRNPDGSKKPKPRKPLQSIKASAGGTTTAYIGGRDRFDLPTTPVPHAPDVPHAARITAPWEPINAPGLGREISHAPAEDDRRWLGA